MLKYRKIPDQEIARVTGMSRATYYRLKKALSILGIKGLKRKSTQPKTYRTSKIPISVIDQILAIRQENPTYGKAKITVILRRDFDIK
jgi:predicted DNA-binding transcriptional regulator AlpA